MAIKVFDYILGKDDRYNRLMVHNIRGLYALCCSKGKSEFYEDVLIGDILVDAENAHDYAKGIEGCRIVETAICKTVDREPAFIMKCPAGGKEELRVKIIFEDRKTFLRQYYKVTDAHRTTPIIIGGDWVPTPDETEYQSQCIIHRAKQIYYVNE